MKNTSVKTIAGVELSIREKHTQHTKPFVVEEVNAPEVLGADDDIRVVAEAVKRNMPVLFIGDTGTGKTSLVRHLSSEVKQPFRRLNLNGSTTVDEFAGRWTVADGGKLQWIDGVLIEAMRHGHWLLLDEINAALPEVLFYLQSLLDDDRMVVLAEKDGEVVRPHPEFRLFATMNPNRDYAGTRDLNKALLSRFPVIIRSRYPSATIESQVITSRAPHVTGEEATTLVKIAHQLRETYQRGEVSYICSTRDLLHVAKLKEFMTLKEAITTGIVNRIDDDGERSLIMDVIKLHVGKFEEKSVVNLVELEREYVAMKERESDRDKILSALNVALRELGIAQAAALSQYPWNMYDETNFLETIRKLRK